MSAVPSNGHGHAPQIGAAPPHSIEAEQSVLGAVLLWDGALYGLPDDEFSDSDVFDDTLAALDQLLKAEGDSLLYVYDFGDDWRHDVVLEEILPGEAAGRPVCIAGERKCPPEDVGGTPGYERFLEVIFDPAHEDHEHMVRWAGGRFQAEEFKLDAVNKYLARLRRPTRQRF